MKETIRRSLRTFFQAAVGYLVAEIPVVVAEANGDFDIFKTALVGIVVAAVAAGIAALMNLPKPPALHGDGDIGVIESEDDEV